MASLWKWNDTVDKLFNGRFRSQAPFRCKNEKEIRFKSAGFGQALDESDPYLKLNKDGIKVYIFSHKNSAFGTFKAITHINASLDSILAVMFDNNSCTEWVDACGESILNSEESRRIMDMMLEFHKQVKAAIVDPSFIAEIRKKLHLVQRETAEICRLSHQNTSKIMLS